MNPILSIIVPVYNVEIYLERCIKSILNQSFKEFELILINDGSTDKSRDICDKYSKLDTRIIVVHQKNLGVSAARNTGLDIARGKYIGFVDADDFIHYSMYKIMIDVIKNTSSDMVVCDYIKVDETYKESEKEIEKVDVESFDKNEVLNKLFIKGAFEVMPWNKVYKKSLFCNLRYKVGRVNEDEFLIHEIVYKCKKISIIDSKIYYYMKRSGSIMNSKFEIRKFDRLYALSERINFFRERNERELTLKSEEWFVDSFIWNYYFAYQNVENIDKELKEIKKEFNKVFKGLMKNRRMSNNKKLTLLLFYFSPKLYYYFVLRQKL